MTYYGKLLLFVFVCLIRGDYLGVGGPLLVQGTDAGVGSRPTPADKSGTPCEKTAAVDIKKYSEEKYTRKIEGSVITYEPQPGYCFNEVKDSGTKIWKTSDQEEYSKKVEADFGTKTVTIYIGSDGLTKVFKKGEKDKKGDDDKKGEKGKKGDDDKWVEDAEASTYKGGSDNSGSDCLCGLDCSCGQDCSCGADCSWSRTWDIIRKYVFCGCGSGDECGFCGLCGLCRSRGISGRKTGVDLDINKGTFFSREFDHARDGNYTTYTAKGSNAFRLVKEGDTEIWEASDQSEYSPRVEVDYLSFESRAITIYLAEKRTNLAEKKTNLAEKKTNLAEKKTKVFIKLGRDEPWTEIDTDKVTTKPVNIGYAYNSFFSGLRTQDNVRIFTARNGFAFNGANVYIDDKKKVEIWKTDNESEYANKIVNVGGTKVEIHLFNGSGKVYTKVSPVQWQEEAYAPQPIFPEIEETSGGSCGWSCMWNTIKGWFGSSGSPSWSSGPSSGSPSGSSSGPSSVPSSGSTSGSPTGSSSGSPSGPGGSSGSPSGPSSGSSKSSAEKQAVSTAQKAGADEAGAVEAGGAGQPGKITSGSSSAKPPSTTGQSAGSQGASGTTAMTSQAGTLTVTTGQGARTGTQPSSIPADKTGYQQQSSTTTTMTRQAGGTQQQSSTQPARTGYQQPSSTQSAKTGSQQPSGQPARTGQAGGGGGSASGGSPAAPPANASEKTATVDIKKQMGTDYMSEMDGYKLTYTPRGEVSFNAVKEDSKEIWKTDKSDEYSKKVMADFGTNVVTIYIGSDGGSTKVFKKGSDGTWKEDSNGSTGKSGTVASGGTTGQGGSSQNGRTGSQQQSISQHGRTGQTSTQSASTYKAGHTAAMTRQAGGGAAPGSRPAS